MTELLSRDYDQVLQVVRELHVPCTLAEFPHRVMALVPRLVRSERTAYSEVNLPQNRITALIHPDDPSAEEIGAWLQPHLGTHPLISHVERTGDLAPRAISDFWSRRRYHRSAIYNECYRFLGVEDQLALPFGPERQVIVAVTLNRGRRTFSDRDRAVLTLLRPHLTQAYLSAAHSTALQNEVATRSAAWEATKRGAIKIGAIGCGALLMRPDASIAFAQAEPWPGSGSSATTAMARRRAMSKRPPHCAVGCGRATRIHRARRRSISVAALPRSKCDRAEKLPTALCYCWKKWKPQSTARLPQLCSRTTRLRTTRLRTTRLRVKRRWGFWMR